jgi:hypothetical protein
MNTIIAGMFDTFAQAHAASERLADSGFALEDQSLFYLAPAGQHARYALGGDQDADGQAKDMHEDAVKGGAVGALAIGAAAAVVAGPVGAITAAAVGAYTGSLVGAMTGSEGDAEPSGSAQRGSGVMLAVRLEQDANLDVAVDALREHAARQVECAQGEWRQSEWVDFDPTRPPTFIWRANAST